jgi:hypothetical protein
VHLPQLLLSLQPLQLQLSLFILPLAVESKRDSCLVECEVLKDVMKNDKIDQVNINVHVYVYSYTYICIFMCTYLCTYMYI